MRGPLSVVQLDPLSVSEGLDGTPACTIQYKRTHLAGLVPVATSSRHVASISMVLSLESDSNNSRSNAVITKQY